MQSMKNVLIIGGIITLLIAGGIWWLSVRQPPSESVALDDAEVIATSGLHWHPQLRIYVNGEPRVIPPNIGVGIQHASMPTYDPAMRMMAIHTHEADGTIHFEFPGRVTREDTRLGNFFTIWGKDLMEFGSRVTMTVNGVENGELGAYEMKDGDVIELRYE